ncbi:MULTISPECIES: SDR family oxidoreductase [Nocardia]|uniref:SDR family oxidoreductase n=1 Tax=Nocardia TaxID=1817 RepID=UPI0007EBA71F|nr:MULTISPECIES: SDR family oxidoreductase [Nocardia]MBF6278652.1 SDR family oxidoreductase [Nocardia nova]OBA53392.1 3-ketoacyl-ACP reductase [Nocardia sp. 852002-51101_SCH5132738]OBB50224.1 3-ketoacyl-ACP reductase [Nocardia sp. 852002-51244_SCH5132740]OBF66691.1 3-ketoacyl-ACP reductase [Mycobacterium sp. 852002-51759_SCH5129042]
MQQQRFEGRVAVVTGASRGIGLAVARRIIEEGGQVCITGRRTEGLQTAVESLGGTDNAMFVAGHADDDEHQEDVIDAVHRTFGRLDILVNNTGINPLYGPMIDSDSAAAQKLFAVNVLAGLEWVRKALAAGFGSTASGAVVNIASVAGLRPAHNIGLYGASKAALLHATAQLALELAPAVRVNAVAPAVIRTRFAGPLFEGKEGELTALYPLGRLGDPDDVAHAVAYLASDQAAWITGQVLTVDGGLTLGGGV